MLESRQKIGTGNDGFCHLVFEMFDKHDEKMTFPTTCKQNPPYPRVRLLCGEFQRIKTPKSVPERLDGDWLLLEYVQ